MLGSDVPRSTADEPDRGDAAGASSDAGAEVAQARIPRAAGRLTRLLRQAHRTGAVLCTAALTAQAEPAPPVWSHANLAAGPRVSILHDPAASSQLTFTFLPCGLLTDGPGEAQLSHLVEHALLRGVDPGPLVVDGMRINGETTGAQLRLESLAPAAQAETAVRRHGRWLRVRGLSAELLAREQQAIAGEVHATVGSGFTHKWALAALAQALHHGRAEAAILGDVQQVTVEELPGAIATRAKLSGEVWILTSGPLAPAEVLRVLTEELDAKPPAAADLPAEAATEPPAKAAAAKTPGEVRWDLPRTHVLVWFPLPQDARSRAGAFLLAHLLQHAVSRDRELARANARVFVSIEQPAPDGQILLLSAAVGSPDQTEPVSARLAELVQAKDPPPFDADRLEFQLDQIARQFDPIPATPRGLTGGFGTDPELVKANLLLQLAYASLALGCRIDEVGTTLADLETEHIRQLWQAHVRDAEPKRLTIFPR